MREKDIADSIKDLKHFAVSKGADIDLIKEIKPDEIVIPKQWVRWKCSFGCKNFGNKLCCPPYAPSPQETREMLDDYTSALLIGFKGSEDKHNKIRHHKKMSKALIELEREAFLKGFEKAFVLGAGTCFFCERCIVEDLPKNTPLEVAKAQCRHSKLMRPSLEALGVDVFSTVKNAGLELEVINTDNVDKTKHFAVLLID